MKLSKYPISSSDKMTSFEFVSEGKKGLIYKIVKFQPTNLKNLYNLAFGDKNSLTGEIDDKVISNNGDSEKVLATIVATIYAFTDKYPYAFVYATGSTKSRTRLYRIGISRFLDEVVRDFDILGEIGEDWEDFQKDIDYEGFLIRRKKTQN
jgi:hypothetical protein